MTPETYIVRVYRRRGDPQQQVAGRVETPSGALCAGFASLTELAAILIEPKAHLHPADPSDASGSSAIKLYRKENAED